MNDNTILICVLFIFLMAGMLLWVSLRYVIPESQIEKKRTEAGNAWLGLERAMHSTYLALQTYSKNQPREPASIIMRQFPGVIRNAFEQHAVKINSPKATKDGWASQNVLAKELTDTLLAWQLRIENGRPWHDQPNG